MKRESNNQKRRQRRFIQRFIPLIGVIFALIGSFVFARGVFAPLPFRKTFVLVGDALHVVSFDPKTHRVTAITIPRDTVIPAALGYGKYAVSAIISLDAIDHQDGKLITGSVSNALGIPVLGYLRLPATIRDTGMSVAVLRRIFSFRSIIGILTDRSDRSITWGQWVQSVFAVAALSADAVRVLDISSSIITTEAPDGTRAPVLDDSRIDYLLDTEFFDGGIRAEGLSVAVYNTTDTAAVGSRASLQLTRVGMQLVFVGNATHDGKLGCCVLSGSPQALNTKTAQFIRHYFGCERSEEMTVGKETGADLVVLLGTDFADQYR